MQAPPAHRSGLRVLDPNATAPRSLIGHGAERSAAKGFSGQPRPGRRPELSGRPRPGTDQPAAPPPSPGRSPPDGYRSPDPHVVGPVPSQTRSTSGGACPYLSITKPESTLPTPGDMTPLARTGQETPVAPLKHRRRHPAGPPSGYHCRIGVTAVFAFPPRTATATLGTLTFCTQHQNIR